MKKRIRIFAVLSLAIGCLGLGACSVPLAAGKVAFDGVYTIATPAHLVHSENIYGTDMISSETNRKVAKDIDQKYQVFHRDLSHMYNTFSKLFFNHDKDDPYLR